MRNGRNGRIWTGLGRLGAPLALALACGAPTAAALAQTFAGATDVVEVEVPVQVVKDGQPVRGLTAADFEVYDGRKKQAITGFHVVDLAAPAAARAAAVPLAGRRQFLLLFDLAFSDPKSVVGARDAARDLVIKGLRPGDLVGVATYSAARGPQIVLGFTSDRRQVDSALETLGLTSGSGQPSDPLRLVLAPPGKGADQRQLAGRSLEADAASTGALLTRDILGPQLAEMNKETGRSDQKAAVTALTRSYSDLARLLGAMPGRKQIVYFSEGFDGSLLTGNAGTSSLISGGEGGGRDVTSDPALASTDESFGSTRSVNDVERMLEELRRADCVIQAVDTGGLRAGGEQRGGARVGGKDSLLTMAKGTGGELYQSSNDLAAGVGAILERTSLTYVLSFQPEKAKTAGEYRKIKVELKGAARGARLAYRSGYYAPRPYPQLNPLEKLFEASSRLMGGAESGSIGSAVLAAPFRAPGGLAWVPVLIEVDGPTLLAGKPQGPQPVLPVEIYVYALDAAGAIQDFLFQQLGMDLAKVEPAIRQTGLKFFGHLELPAGEYSVRTLVRNGTSGAFSLRVSPLTVPDFAAGPVLLPPLFPEPAGRWLMTRESPRGAQVPYPFMAKQQPYIPASRPALAEGREVPLALVGYNLGPGSLKAEAQVLTLDGKEAGTGGVRVLERESGGGSGPDRLSAAFTPPRLAPGEYVLRVTVSGEAGSAGASSAPFVVGAASAAPPAAPPASPPASQ